MKKIGLIFGEPFVFARELIETLNLKGPDDIQAEAVTLAHISHQGEARYDCILDLHPQTIQLYRSFLQAEALKGCLVLNNPHIFSGFDRFLASVAAENVLLNVPPTHLLPSYDRPKHTTARSFTNLAYPWAWDDVGAQIGFPAILKPVRGGEPHQTHRVDSLEELFQAHATGGEEPMLLQRWIDSEEVYLCFYIGNSYQEVMVLPFDSVQGQFKSEEINPHPILSDTLKMHTRALAHEYGCDFCSFVFAIEKEEPYLIDVHHPVIFLQEEILGEARFNHLISTVADMLLEKIHAKEAGVHNLSWGGYMAQPHELPLAKEASPESEAPEGGDNASYLIIENAAEKVETEMTGQVLGFETEDRTMGEESPAEPEKEEEEDFSNSPESWADFNKEVHVGQSLPTVSQFEEEEVATEAEIMASEQEDLLPGSHLPPEGIRVSESKQKILERIRSRRHQLNFDRIGSGDPEGKDDLKRIIGIGPFIEEKLHALGLYSFRQLAAFTQEDEALLNEIIEFFPGRIERDEWIAQAKELLEQE